ncbi:MAG: hypothetical protein H6751_15900 [Candidatus Omnitrophica bacterium]|nr:hypothetical protein [Candidatus Omnitrophota bacterium]
MTKTTSRAVSTLAFIALLILTAQPTWSQNRIQSIRELRERVIDRTNESNFFNSLRMSLLSGIAFYPDEVIAAIFEVAQDPDTLEKGTDSTNEEYNQAMELLSVHPEIIQKMKDHPAAVRIIGEMAEKNLAHTWKLIDDLRAQYHEESGISVAEAMIADGTPPVVAIDSAGETENDEDDVVVDLSAAGSVYVEDPNDPGMVYVYPATAVAYPVGVTAYYANGNAAVGGGGVVVTEDGDIYAAKGGAAVVETQNGTVAVGGVGHAQVDTEDGDFSTGATVGAVNDNGEGVIAHRESDGSWDENSFDRSVEGNVQATNGQGFQYEKDQSLQKTEDGISRERSGSVETNDGRSAEYDSSSSVTKGEDGVEVDRGGSATGPSGETVEWGNQNGETAKSSGQKQKGSTSLKDPANWEPPAANSASSFRSSSSYTPRWTETSNSSRRSEIENRGGQMTQASRSFHKPTEQTWDHFSPEKNGNAKSSGSKYRRSGEALKSKEAFSGRSLNSQSLGTAIDRGLKHQQFAFETFEPDIGGFQGPNHSGKRQGTGFQGPNRSGRKSYSGFQGNSAGGFQPSNRGGGRGGRR